MTKVPDTWSEIKLDPMKVCVGEPLARAFGWTFWEHPEEGDEHPVLAVTFDRIGPDGPVVWNTHDFDVPEYL